MLLACFGVPRWCFVNVRSDGRLLEGLAGAFSGSGERPVSTGCFGWSSVAAFCALR